MNRSGSPSRAASAWTCADAYSASVTALTPFVRSERPRITHPLPRKGRNASAFGQQRVCQSDFSDRVEGRCAAGFPIGQRRGERDGRGPVDIEHPGILNQIIGFVDIGFSDFTAPGAAGVRIEAEQHKIVGACLAAARRRARITQQDLAARLGKPQSFVSEYERGQRRVDVVELIAISRELGVAPVAIFAEIIGDTESGSTDTRQPSRSRQMRSS